MMVTEIILCECGSKDHQIILSCDDGSDLVYVSVHLAPLPFWKRIIKAARYVFGYRSTYGNWDHTVISSDRLKKAVERTISEQIHYLRSIGELLRFVPVTEGYPDKVTGRYICELRSPGSDGFSNTWVEYVDFDRSRNGWQTKHEVLRWLTTIN